MSSHHIVRDRQEPALLVTLIEDFNPDYLGQMLEWSPVVFAMQSEADKLHSLGIKIDYIFVQDTEIKITSASQEHTELIVLSELDVLNAIQFLIEDEFSAVNITGKKEILDVIFPFVGLIDLALITETHKWYPVNKVLEKWYKRDEVLWVYNSPSTNHFELSNTSKSTNNSFVTLTDGIVTIQTNNNPIFVGENLH